MLKRSLHLCLMLAALLSAAPAHAYFCWGEDKRDPRQLMTDADVVFTGTVEKLEEMGIAPDELKTPRTNVVFRVQKLWKGLPENTPGRVGVDTEAFYEYNFKVGESYLVFGYRIYDNRISMIGCPRIRTVAESQKAIRLLGKPSAVIAAREPVPAAAKPDILPMAQPPVQKTEEAKPVPAPAPKLDDDSVDELLNTLQEEAPAQPVPAPAPAPAPGPEPVPAPAPAPATEAVPAPEPAPVEKSAPPVQNKPAEQLGVTWGEKPKPLQDTLPEPSEEPTQQLDVIWDNKKSGTQATPPAAPALPPPPVPRGGTP